jgi:hypothetical protein
MITDFQATLSNAQAFTATGPTTDAYDTGANYDSNRGEPFGILYTVDVAADTSSANETYAFSVETDDNTGFSSATVLTTLTVAGAQLTAGAKVWVPAPLGLERYVRGRLTLGGTTPSITVTAEWKPACDVATETSSLPVGYSVS